MKQTPLFAATLTGLLAVSALCPGCGEDGSDSNSADTADKCIPEVIVGELANGEPCTQIDDCASGFCATYSHAPADPDAVCAEAPPPGDIHLTASVRDFMTGELMTGVSFRLAGATQVVQDPVGFPAAGTFISDADGRIDEVLTDDTVKLALGLVVVGTADGYYPTTTGLVEPELGCGVYPSGIRNPDLKMMSEADLASLSAMFEADFPDESPNLPFGERGGVVGTVRFVDTGDGVPGCELRSGNANSNARIYYLNESGDGFVQDKTHANGLFVILGAGLAERFDAWVGDVKVSRRSATCGETMKVLFSTTLQVESIP